MVKITYDLENSDIKVMAKVKPILDRELGPSGGSPNQRSRWKHAPRY